MDFTALFKPERKKRSKQGTDGKPPLKPKASRPGARASAGGAAASKERADAAIAATPSTPSPLAAELPTPATRGLDDWEAKETQADEDDDGPEARAFAAGSTIPGQYMIHFRPAYGDVCRRKRPAVLKSCTCAAFSPTPFRPDLCYCGFPKEMHPELALHVLAGWMQQEGNTCAAASVAGAINALLPGGRRSERAMDVSEALREYLSILSAAEARAEDRLTREIPEDFAEVKRLLGDVPLQSLKSTQYRGRLFAVTNPMKRRLQDTWVASLRAYTEHEVVVNPDRASSPLLPEAVAPAAEGAAATVPEDASPSTTLASSGPLEAFPSAGDLAAMTEHATRAARMDWLRERRAYWQARQAKFARQEKRLWTWWQARWGSRYLPANNSTSPVGNARALICAKRLARRAGLRVEAFTLFHQQRARRGMVISEGDPEALQAQQWALLCSHVRSADTVVIFHLKNHYCLLYGAREYTDPTTGELQRHVLGARGGQVRSAVLQWFGYGVLCVRLARGAPASIGVGVGHAAESGPDDGSDGSSDDGARD